MKLFGIEIDRKTDILAFAAFVISITQLIYSLYGFMSGPRVRLYPSEQILMKVVEYPRAGRYLMLNTRMAYVNTGQPGNNTAIGKETISFRILGNDGEWRRYEHQWQRFESFDLVGTSLRSIKSEPAIPVPINAGSAVSHETSFAPRSVPGKEGADKWKNFLPWEDFIAALNRMESHGIRRLEFTVTAEILGKKPISTTYEVDLDRNLIDRLTRETWASPACTAKE